MQPTLSNRPVSDDDAADALANQHPKSNPPTLHDAHTFPANSSGSGSAPGANGPPTTGDVTPAGTVF
jgi:hypothetical protein